MKTMSKAYKCIDEQRDAMIGYPDDPSIEKIICDDLSFVVYKYKSDLGPSARGYRGRSKKPSFAHYFKTDERREAFLTDFISNCLERVNQDKARKTVDRKLKAGDILKSSWGYDQTNIDYYLVTELIGKQSVELVEIGKESIQTESMQGGCIPDPSHIIGEPMVRRVIRGTSVNVKHGNYANLKEPKLIAGAKIYDADYWSAYY